MLSRHLSTIGAGSENSRRKIQHGKSKAATMFSQHNTPLPDGKMPQLRVMPMPADANIHGDVFGGWIMAQVDIAGSLPAVRRANGRVATVAVNSFVFKHPVFVGDLLSFYADIVKVGNTSITVNVEVYAERNRLQAETVKVTEATLTYVATGEDRKPRLLPALASLGL
jgi:acyl-CoA thioesterase YciA